MDFIIEYFISQNDFMKTNCHFMCSGYYCSSHFSCYITLTILLKPSIASTQATQTSTFTTTTSQNLVKIIMKPLRESLLYTTR